MNNPTATIKTWIEYANQKTPDKLSDFFLLWDYIDGNLSPQFYINHFIEMQEILSTLDKNKSDVREVVKHIEEKHFV